MHRQSLGGSPASKLHHANGALVAAADIAHIPSASAAELQKNLSNDDDDEEESKSQKKPLKSTPHEKFIHLIPILILLCILILYLSSHHPSQSDLAQFNGLNHLSKPMDATNIDDIQRALGVGKGEVLAIRSMRNLQQDNSKHRLNRKNR